MLKQAMKNPVVFKETREYPKGRGFKFQLTLNTLFYPFMLIAPFIFVCIIYTFYDKNLTAFQRDLTSILRGCFIFSTGVQFFYILSSAASGTLHAFTREKEQKTYDSLVSTLMSPADIVYGKLVVGLYPVMKTLLLFSPLFILIGLLSDIPFRGLLIVFVYSLVFCLFCGIFGLFSSAWSATTGKAHNLATTLLGGTILGTFIVDFAINMAVNSVTPIHGPVPLTTLLSPGLGYISAALWYCTKPENWFWYFWILQMPLLLLITGLLWRFTVKKIGEIPRT